MSVGADNGNSSESPGRLPYAKFASESDDDWREKTQRRMTIKDSIVYGQKLENEKRNDLSK